VIAEHEIVSLMKSAVEHSDTTCVLMCEEALDGGVLERKACAVTLAVMRCIGSQNPIDARDAMADALNGPPIVRSPDGGMAGGVDEDFDSE